MHRAVQFCITTMLVSALWKLKTKMNQLQLNYCFDFMTKHSSHVKECGKLLINPQFELDFGMFQLKL